MLPGFNHNLRHLGKVFHVQTEDSGMSHPHVITQVFLGGQIIAVEKSSYQAEVSAGMEKKALLDLVRSKMQTQHKRLMKSLIQGTFDERIDGGEPPPKPKKDEPKHPPQAASLPEPPPIPTDAPEAPTILALQTAAPRLAYTPADPNRPRFSVQTSPRQHEGGSNIRPQAVVRPKRAPSEPARQRKGLVAPPLPEIENEDPTISLPRLMPSDQAITQPDMDVAEAYASKPAPRPTIQPHPTRTSKPKIPQENHARRHFDSTSMLTKPPEITPDRTLLDFGLPGALKDQLQRLSKNNHRKSIKRPATPQPEPLKEPAVPRSGAKPNNSNILVVERSLDEVLLSYLDDEE